MSVNPRIF